MNTIQIEHKNTQMIAHRGIDWLEKENTLPSFRMAGEHSYWGIETDVHKTADGIFVTCHDSNLLRVSGKDMLIKEETYDTVRAVRLYDIADREGREDLFVPTLSEYLELCRQYGKYSIVELKTECTKEDIAELLALTDCAGNLEKTVFISFRLSNLIYLRELAPTQPAQWIIGKELPENWYQTLLEHRLDLAIYHKHLSKELVEELHHDGIKINCWRINEPGQGIYYAEMGVDYITTDILE